MARPKTYDSDDALDNAMRVFWRKGFAETSYDDLTRETGVSRKGLYTSFGDKHALFVKSLERYSATIGISFLAELDEPRPTPDTIKGMFLRIGAMTKTEFGHMGCFIANTAADETVNDAEVSAQVTHYLEGLRKRFALALTRAGWPKSRIPQLSDFLTGFLQGLFLLAHGRAPAGLIDNFISEGLKALNR